ncbi:hypothetical protein AKJ51_00735 [candidate division MSBL1 archaeon SCGC-AAA382A20]|uniref:RNA polymerase sigma factor 70 region 4 type 2 domain-containing protein n=1 Tax=candidate division MSBL1 archaeon SCGC-AAA382A20 TaxID=1698280 RepID=A0A133VMI9_9EURY|nr:hypothetical protein AKJ51_00735 [candidate division MSBL1 archaeon SCGC-AAA382A20]
MSHKLSQATKTLRKSLQKFQQAVAEDSLPVRNISESKIIETIEKLSDILFMALNKSFDFSSLCEQCDRREECEEPCEKLNEMLPGVEKGRGRRENRQEWYPMDPERDRREDFREVYDQFRRFSFHFTEKQFEAVALYYRDCMTETEIAEKLEISISSVNGRLQRAREKIEELRKNTKKDEITERKVKKRGLGENVGDSLKGKRR